MRAQQERPARFQKVRGSQHDWLMKEVFSGTEFSKFFMFQINLEVRNYTFDYCSREITPSLFVVNLRGPLSANHSDLRMISGKVLCKHHASSPSDQATHWLCKISDLITNHD